MITTRPPQTAPITIAGVSLTSLLGLGVLTQSVIPEDNVQDKYINSQHYMYLQSNFKCLNTFGITKICSRQG